MTLAILVYASTSQGIDMLSRNPGIRVTPNTIIRDVQILWAVGAASLGTFLNWQQPILPEMSSIACRAASRLQILTRQRCVWEFALPGHLLCLWSTHASAEELLQLPGRAAQPGRTGRCCTTLWCSVL